MPAAHVKILESADYPAEIRRGAQVLNDGGVVVLPTETIYGVAGRLDKPVALRRLKEFRLGSAHRPLTPHLADAQVATQFIGPITDLARRMMKKLWPGPVGLQFAVDPTRRKEVADCFAAAENDLYEGELITLRCPESPVFQGVAGHVKGPLVATAAANGTLDVKSLEGKVDLILDAGPPRFSKPSTLVRITGDTYKIVRSGVYDERIIQRLLRTTILFVCSGNTCRSPMAESLARKILSDQLKIAPDALENKGINVVSAGSHAMPGSRATPQAADAVKALGADLSRHRSRPLTVELIHEADAIFTMSRGHAQAVIAMVPSASEKVRPLDPQKDIEDPIGGDARLYNELAGQMVTLIEARLKDQILP